MWSAAAVLRCALSMLGRGASTLPPIVFLEVPPPHASPNVEAFVGESDDTIYLITSAPAFQAARRSHHVCGDPPALKKLASIIVHEEWHVRHGSDERGAYDAQLMALRAPLRVDPDSSLFLSVRRSRDVAVKAQERAGSPVAVLASTQAPALAPVEGIGGR